MLNHWWRQLVRRFGYRLNAPRGGKSRKLSRSYRPRLETLEDRTLMTGGILDSAFGIVFSFRWTGAALASGIMGFPLMVRAIRLSIEAVDARLEEAAGTLGANRVWVFLTITLPLIVPGIIAGMILCFAKAIGEFGATITFVSNIPGETQTLPSAIYSFTQVPGGDVEAFRLTLVSVSIAMLALFASELMARRANRRLDIE